MNTTVRIRKRLIVHACAVRILAFLGLSLATCVSGIPQESERTVGQFQHTTWGAKEGARSPIYVIAQTKGGYLWLGTSVGLYRFDGVSFERYEPRAGGPLPADKVSSLLALENGDLWIGFSSGRISLLREGNATNYTTREGVPAGDVTGLARGQEGTIWAATFGGLARFEGTHWKSVGKDWNFPGRSAQTVFLNREGTLWVATEDTLVFLPPGAGMFQPTGVHVGVVMQIAEAPNGKLWMAETTRSVRPIPLSGQLLPADETEIRVGGGGILFDRQGGLWITTLGDGLRRAPHPNSISGKPGRFSRAIESFAATNGLTDDFALSLLQDREGNVWVGTQTGLDRFRKTNFVPVAISMPLRQTHLTAGDAGDIWVQGLNLLAHVHRSRAYEIRDISAPHGSVRGMRVRES